MTSTHVKSESAIRPSKSKNRTSRRVASRRAPKKAASTRHSPKVVALPPSIVEINALHEKISRFCDMAILLGDLALDASEDLTEKASYLRYADSETFVRHFENLGHCDAFLEAKAVQFALLAEAFRSVKEALN